MLEKHVTLWGNALHPCYHSRTTPHFSALSLRSRDYPTQRVVPFLSASSCACVHVFFFLGELWSHTMLLRNATKLRGLVALSSRGASRRLLPPPLLLLQRCCCVLHFLLRASLLSFFCAVTLQ
jgi:hypothetical protein